MANEYRLPEEGADKPGRYNPDYVPSLWGIFAALDDIRVRLVVLMKAAQVGWTFGLIGYEFKRIDNDPSPIIMIFPKDGDARKFADEKLVPAIKATPSIAAKIDTKARKDGNRSLFKKFPGGFLSLVGSNSIGNVKSTPAPLVIIEEPDDTNENIKQQGDAIRLARERIKRYRNGKLVLGGTPKVKGISRVEEYTNLSDQRVLPIRCHECGDKHVLDWTNVTWVESDSGPEHAVYGRALPDTAMYACPHCGAVWDDYQRQENIKTTVKQAVAAGDPMCGWVPTVETSGGIVGFKELNEMYCCIPGTSLADVVRDYLEAEHDYETKGDEAGRIVFVNSKLGRPYEFKSNAPEIDELADRGDDYPELWIPEGALIATAGVDVQHNRLAPVIWAYGPGEEMWLIYFNELMAAKSVNDINDPVWAELDKLLFSPIPHARGFNIHLSAISIDASDGQTSDAVYNYVRKRQSRGVMAAKGDSHDYGKKEIFSLPRKIDHKTKTKAAKYGLQVYMVGTEKAKDLLIGDNGRVTLIGPGPGRMHWYKTVRADFYEQLLSEVKAPHPRMRHKRVWQLKSGVRNEGLDGTVLSLHAARSVKSHIMTPAQWAAIEKRLAQADLFNQEKDQPAPSAKPQSPLTTKLPGGGFATGWRK